MHILVSVKRVVDYNVKVRVKSDGTAVETTGVKMSINPFDEVALEQAVRLREQGLASRVTAITIGTPVAADVLRTALAQGADDAVLVASGDALEPLVVARLLAEFVQRQKIDLVLCGKQAIDGDLGATGPMLAALLDWPQAVSVSRLALVDGALELACDADGGTERLVVALPAVLAVDLRLCDTRHITLPAMMKAKKAQLRTLDAAELAPAATPQVRLTRMSEPPARAPGLRLDGLAELIACLRELPAFQAAL